MTNLFDQESSTDPSEPGTQPSTPEPRSHATADTTPESLRTAPAAGKQVFERLGGRRFIDLVTTSSSSKASSTEGITDNSDHSSQYSGHGESSKVITKNRGHYSYHPFERDLSGDIADNSDHCSHYSIQSTFTEEVSARPNLTPTLTTNPNQEETHSPLFIVTSIYHKVIRPFTLAKQRKSRADDARVQDTINLIKSLPTIRRTGVRNLKRRLTVTQYRQLLRAIEDPEDRRLPSEIKDRLRFDYTSHKRQFEIRMPTTLHGSMSGLFIRSVVTWQNVLMQSSDDRISNAAESLRPYPESSVSLKGGSDLKTPDCSMQHICERPCLDPTLVLEVAWTETKEELRQKADMYIRSSNGEIRTVVAVYMNEMWKAERKNESRLERMYRKGELDSNESYSYYNDENNRTGSASILVWRARKKNDTVRAGKLQETMFRDEEGNAIQSASLQLQLQDFICTDIADSLERGKRFKAPLLEISSEDLCRWVQEALNTYRRKRPEAVKKTLEKTTQKKEEEKERREERLRKATEATAREVGSRRSEDEGLLGRVIEGGKWLSARIRNKK